MIPSSDGMLNASTDSVHEQTVHTHAHVHTNRHAHVPPPPFTHDNTWYTNAHTLNLYFFFLCLFHIHVHAQTHRNYSNMRPAVKHCEDPTCDPAQHTLWESTPPLLHLFFSLFFFYCLPETATQKLNGEGGDVLLFNANTPPPQNKRRQKSKWNKRKRGPPQAQHHYYFSFFVSVCARENMIDCTMQHRRTKCESPGRMPNCKQTFQITVCIKIYHIHCVILTPPSPVTVGSSMRGRSKQILCVFL